VPSFPFSIDWLPNGPLLIVSARDRLLLRREPDGRLVTHADLTHLSDHPWNEIVADGRGNVYVNNIGFDFPGGEFAPGIVALVTPDGVARQVADGIAFPNGMVVTPDNGTLILAESYGKQLTAFDIAADGSLSKRRVWANLGDGAPDGICLDAEGAVWYETFRTSAACASAQAAKYCRRSILTAAALPACLVARTAKHCSCWRPSGAARRTCTTRGAQVRC
jgi:sugar lactone lactonase YvrE